MVAAREPRIVELRADVHRITIGGGKTDIAARLKAAVAGGRGQLVDLEPVAGKAAVDDHVRQPRAIGLIFIGHATPADHTVEAGVEDAATERSEEHTSEHQSLMRISYAVFCLKKKKTHKS